MNITIDKNENIIFNNKKTGYVAVGYTTNSPTITVSPGTCKIKTIKGQKVRYFTSRGAPIWVGKRRDFNHKLFRILGA